MVYLKKKIVSILKYNALLYYKCHIKLRNFSVLKFNYFNICKSFSPGLYDNLSSYVTASLFKSWRLYYTLHWTVSILPWISHSFRFSRALGTVPSTLIYNGINVTCIYHTFFGSMTRSKYLFLFSIFFIFILWLTGTAKSSKQYVLFFL